MKIARLNAFVRAEAGDSLEAGELPTRFTILAYTGGPLNVDGFDLPIVIDLQGLDASVPIPIPIKHNTDDEFILGQTDPDGITNDGSQLTLTGPVTADPDQSSSVKRVLTMAMNGHQWQASVGAEVEESYDIAAGETITANGQQLTGPFTLATRSVLRETSVLGLGADKNTKVIFAQAKGNIMSFEEWVTSIGFDPATLSDEQKQGLMETYTKLQSATAEEETEPEEEVVAEGDEEPADETPDEEPEKKAVATAKAGAKTTQKVEATMPTLNQRISAERREYAREMQRVRTIKAEFGKDEKLVEAAIEKGWSVEKTGYEFHKRQQRKEAPSGHRSESGGSIMLQALQGAMILRAGGKLDHGGFTGSKARHLGLPAWLRAGLNTDQRQRVMDAAHEFDDMSMVDICRECCQIDGREPTEKGRKGWIRAAVSGASVTDIFTTSINAVMLQKLDEAEDSTTGWTRETDVQNFMTQDRIRLVKGAGLSLHKRGGTADDATRDDGKESYKIYRYSQKFTLDEQDFIDDRFQALADMPNEMALAAARLRPDLVYAILLANGTLSTTSTALFSATQPGGGDVSTTQANLATGAALSSSTLQAAIAAMFNFRENGVGLNLHPTHLIVPAGLIGTAFNLLQGQNIAAGAGTTNSGDINPLAAIQKKFGQIEVVSDQRLTNGVTDPLTGTAYSGSATTWRMACNRVPTIEVAYLAGTGRAPQVRQYVLDKGAWGLGWDVNLDVGAKALEWRGLYEARA